MDLEEFIAIYNHANPYNSLSKEEINAVKAYIELVESRETDKESEQTEIQ